MWPKIFNFGETNSLKDEIALSKFAEEYFCAPKIDPKVELAYRLLLEEYVLTETHDRNVCRYRSEKTGDAIPMTPYERDACRKYFKRIEDMVVKIALDKELFNEHFERARRNIGRYSFEKAKDLVSQYEERLL